MPNHNHNVCKNPTRGFGILETFLAKKRAEMANILIDSKARDGRILDIGCGSFPHFLLSTKFHEKYGVDLTVHKKTLAGKTNDTIILKKINFEKQTLPFRDNFFDVVVMLAVFEHISPDQIVILLKDARRVLKKNGSLILTTPSPWAAPLLWFLSRFYFLSKEEIDDHKSAFTPQHITDLLTQAEFSKKTITHDYFELFFNMWFVAKK